MKNIPFWQSVIILKMVQLKVARAVNTTRKFSALSELIALAMIAYFVHSRNTIPESEYYITLIPLSCFNIPQILRFVIERKMSEKWLIIRCKIHWYRKSHRHMYAVKKFILRIWRHMMFCLSFRTASNSISAANSADADLSISV